MPKTTCLDVHHLLIRIVVRNLNEMESHFISFFCVSKMKHKRNLQHGVNENAHN